MATANNPLLELHRKADAEIGDWLGASLPAQFDAIEAEYARAQSVALLDTNYHTALWLDGSDRVRYLNAVLTNDVAGLKEGHGSMGLLLNPQGHILAELRVHAMAERLLILGHASVRARTSETLEKFIIMDDATLTDATDDFGSIALEGPRAAQILYEACALKLDAMDPHAHREVMIGAISCRAFRFSHFAQPGVELLADRQHLPALWQTVAQAARATGGGPVGYAALNTLRLEAGVPWFGHDFDDKVIPHEAALEYSHISYTKGCYTGQEIVERVRSRGHVNRRRVGLQFAAAEPPPANAKLTADGKEVGHVSSAAFSPRAGAPIGMGYVRREHTAPGSKLQCGAASAEVIELPLTS